MGVPGVDVGAIVGAGIQANASVTGDVLQYLGAQEQRRAQEQLYDRQTAYQTAMVNTAHQREIADLKAAGLNPILSGTGGGGAQSPSAPSYTPQNLMGGMKFSAGDSVRTFLDARKTLSEIGVNESVEKINQVEAVKRLTDAEISGADLRKLNLVIESMERDLEVMRTVEGKTGKPLGPLESVFRAVRYLRGLDISPLKILR